MILTEQKIINEVLERLNEKVDTKIDLTDDKHLAKLEYIMLFEMDFPLSDTHEMLDRLTEKRKPGDVWKTQTGWAGLKPGEERAQYGMSDKETAQKYVSGEEEEPKDSKDRDSEEEKETSIYNIFLVPGQRIKREPLLTGFRIFIFYFAYSFFMIFDFCF